MSNTNKDRTTINSLRKYRRSRGYKLWEVANILGLKSPSALSRWESGKSLPDTQNALRLSGLYRTFVDALFTDLAHDLKGDVRKVEREFLTRHQERGVAAGKPRASNRRFDPNFE